jgi:putative tryptophan/tyrosine transport system substrate-binding protein
MSAHSGAKMKRREFITLVFGAAAQWSRAARAEVLPIIGFVSSRSSADSRYVVAAFRKGLSESGYTEGQNVKIEFRWAEGKYDRLPALVSDLIAQGINVLVAVGGEPSAFAAKAATSTIPIVFTTGGDPVKAGLVASLNRPGGNATGISLLTTAPESKRLGLLHETVPKAALIGVLINPNYAEAEHQTREVQDAAHSIGQEVRISKAGNDGELDFTFATFIQQRIEALLVCSDPFFDTRRDKIIGFAAQSRIPAIYQFREYAVAGGLMSYGISLTEGYRQVGIYAAQILKGTKPAELPIQQSIKFEFVINAKTAKALGLEVPPTVLARADEVIE